MKTTDLRQIAEFSLDAKSMLRDVLSSLLDERLIDQPIEAYAVYLANIRWAMYEAIEALGRLERMAETAAPLWAVATPEEVKMKSTEESVPALMPGWVNYLYAKPSREVK